MNKKRSISITIVCILLGFILSWQYKSIYINSQTQRDHNVRLEDLMGEVISLQKNNEDLREKVLELQAQRRQYERDMGDKGLIEQNLKKELSVARLIAGMTDVRGSGIMITLEGKVTDADILSVVNELRASEAQAIAVNNQRIISTSEVRKGGNTIVVNQRRIARPYEIKAIADPDKLENALEMAGGVFDTLKFYNISYEIEKKDDLFIPKVDSLAIKTNYLEVVE